VCRCWGRGLNPIDFGAKITNQEILEYNSCIACTAWVSGANRTPMRQEANHEHVIIHKSRLWNFPQCSRDYPGLCRVKPVVVEVSENRLDPWPMQALFAAAGLTPLKRCGGRNISRAEFGIDGTLQSVTTRYLLAMLEHPVLVQPAILHAKAWLLCRPSETIVELLDCCAGTSIAIQGKTGR